jgi:hypothetical protein
LLDVFPFAFVFAFALSLVALPLPLPASFLTPPFTFPAAFDVLGEGVFFLLAAAFGERLPVATKGSSSLSSALMAALGLLPAFLATSGLSSLSSFLTSDFTFLGGGTGLEVGDFGVVAFGVADFDFSGASSESLSAIVSTIIK